MFNLTFNVFSYTFMVNLELSNRPFTEQDSDGIKFSV